jgi:hypothetical protein
MTRFTGKIDGGPEEGTDTGLLLGDLRFSSAVEPGLELVDIIVNATRRALVGALGEAGWCGIPAVNDSSKRALHKIHLPAPRR